MPELVLEVGEDGSIAKVPEPVQKLIDKAFGQGQAKAMDEAAKNRTTDPATAERLKAAEIENSRLKEAEAVRTKNFEEAERLRNERHANELKERDEKLKAKDDEVSKRTTRIQELVSKDIRVAALEAGARRESLEELEALLGRHIRLDDALQPVVVDGKDAGKPLLDKDGQPVTVEGFVAQYLTDHPHHKAAPSGRGGGASGGRSLSGQPVSADPALNAASTAAAEPTRTNINRAFQEINKVAAK
jgi:hypothetical protein